MIFAAIGMNMTGSYSVNSSTAQHSVQWTLGILARFQAFFYASAFSV
jgi:hypothetical protein